MCFCFSSNAQCRIFLCSANWHLTHTSELCSAVTFSCGYTAQHILARIDQLQLSFLWTQFLWCMRVLKTGWKILSTLYAQPSRVRISSLVPSRVLPNACFIPPPCHYTFSDCLCSCSYCHQLVSARYMYFQHKEALPLEERKSGLYTNLTNQNQYRQHMRGKSSHDTQYFSTEAKPQATNIKHMMPCHVLYVYHCGLLLTETFIS